MKYSAFSFVHNAIAGGYPIREAIYAVQPYVDEVVVVDMESTDGTKEFLIKLGVRVLEGHWGTKAEGTLRGNHALHTECKNDLIIHFEADEVWDDSLIRAAVFGCHRQAIVYRIQVEQNFQRMRWAPHQVHRVFEKGTATKSMERGHTTNQHDEVKTILGPERGFLWDCTYCFRDNWKTRAEQNAFLWSEEPQYSRCTPEHFMYPPRVEDVDTFLREPHWTFQASPFKLPEVLRFMVGKTKYE